MSASRKLDTVIRNQIADYLNLGAGDTESWVFCNSGFSQLNESPNAQVDKKAYIGDASKTATIKGYETTFPFNTDLIKSEEAVMAIYGIARDQKTGGDAELDYLRVELFFPVEAQPNTFRARKFRVAVEVSGIEGDGGEIVKVTGNFNNVGSFIDGTFNTKTKTFTAAGEAVTPPIE